ncbi:MAG: carbamate kinase [Melioribacteraceae bacterium]|nr:carbamate kinase [Melioribacteraceae bacterium]
MKKIAVVALGGNALLRASEAGTIEQQEKNAYDTLAKVLGLIRNGYSLVITHGNGPQVGNIMLRNEAGFEKYKIPKMPLDICVADSQGGIGYMLERQMRNVFNDFNIDKNVVSLITQVLVDIKDPAFENPTKPVGSFYIKEEADLLGKANNWQFKEDSAKRGWRRIVASPVPQDIMNKQIIEELVLNGHVVIAVGGGGVPIYRHENNFLEAIEAVIDKDRASSLLATQINAEELYIITDVPKVYINYGKADQKSLDVITVSEAEKYIEENQFADGSMKPKILAAINFIKNGGRKSIITSEEEIGKENGGTQIISG